MRSVQTWRNSAAAEPVIKLYRWRNQILSRALRADQEVSDVSRPTRRTTTKWNALELNETDRKVLVQPENDVVQQEYTLHQHVAVKVRKTAAAVKLPTPVLRPNSVSADVRRGGAGAVNYELWLQLSARPSRSFVRRQCNCLFNYCTRGIMKRHCPAYHNNQATVSQ